MEINIDINELDKLKKKYHEIINAIPVMKKETTQYNVCDLNKALDYTLKVVYFQVYIHNHCLNHKRFISFV